MGSKTAWLAAGIFAYIVIAKRPGCTGGGEWTSSRLQAFRSFLQGYEIEGRILSMKRDQRGFTLMELMIVIVIIGVLAAIGVPAYNNYTKKARTAVCDANMRTIQTAVGLYYAEEGTYPVITDTTTDEETAPSLLKAYLDNVTEIKCPIGKSGYSVDAEGNVTCIKATAEAGSHVE
jgi:prepilin-type N-terminal cleavage/methylation domain-containing protein